MERLFVRNMEHSKEAGSRKSLLVKWYSKYRIQKAINFHLQMRNSILWARGYTVIDGVQIISWDESDTADELWHRAASEYRCVYRLEKLLKKYL